jgi:hypothetical protein
MRVRGVDERVDYRGHTDCVCFHFSLHGDVRMGGTAMSLLVSSNSNVVAFVIACTLLLGVMCIQTQKWVRMCLCDLQQMGSGLRTLQQTPLEQTLRQKGKQGKSTSKSKSKRKGKPT